MKRSSLLVSGRSFTRPLLSIYMLSPLRGSVVERVFSSLFSPSPQGMERAGLLFRLHPSFPHLFIVVFRQMKAMQRHCLVVVVEIESLTALECFAA